MNKTIFLSLHTKQDYENTDLEFALYLSKYLKFDFYYGTNSLRKYGYNYNFIKQINSRYKKLKSIPIKNFIDLRKKLIEYETLIITSLSGVSKIVEFAKSIGMNVIVIDKYFNYDYDRNIKADLILFKNLYAFNRYKKISKNSDFLKYKITGALQSIYLSKNFIKQKKYIKKKYKLQKKFALILTTGIQHHDKWYIKKTSQIINLLKSKKFDILIKRHPNETIKSKLLNKRLNFKSEISIEEKDFYTAIKSSNLIVSISTNAYQEVNLMGKPIIFVDRQKFLLPEILRKKINLKYKISYSIKKFKIFNRIKWLFKKNLNNFNWSVYTGELRKEQSNFKYYGLECSFEEFKKNINFIESNYNKKRNLNNFQDIKKISPYQNLELFQKNTNYILNFLEKSNYKKKYIKKFMYTCFLELIDITSKIRFFITKHDFINKLYS